jgi:KUP system potassium uptake protein
VGPEERVSIKPLGGGIYDVSLYFGFMDDADVPAALRLAKLEGLPIDVDDTTYFLGRETLIPTKSPGMAQWREHLFVLMARNAVRATGFFRLPAERVVELGVQVEL